MAHGSHGLGAAVVVLVPDVAALAGEARGAGQRLAPMARGYDLEVGVPGPQLVGDEPVVRGVACHVALLVACTRGSRACEFVAGHCPSPTGAERLGLGQHIQDAKPAPFTAW